MRNCEKKRVYPETDCVLRTEESFLRQSQKEHHTGTTPLTRVPGFKPISSFVLDYMHLICLGIMKRLLVFYWIGAKKKTHVSFSRNQVSKLSARLESLRKSVPVEFPRKIRGLAEAARFKATEYRFFLLYSGPIVLKGILKTELYKHFLLLHTATRILCSAEMCSLAEYAKSLYKHFFNFLENLYGSDSQITNMHHVLHLADDVINFKCTLDMLSSFDFENELGKTKRLLRSPNKPLAQYCQRKQECDVLPLPKKRMSSKPVCKQSRGMTKVMYQGVTLTSHEPDNFVLLKNESILEITEIKQERNPVKDLIICGNIWKKKDLFQFPCASSKLNEWEIEAPSSTKSVWKIQEVKSKLIRFKLQEDGEERCYAVAILHSEH